MIAVTEEPFSISGLLVDTKPPVPLSDCWRWCLQPDDADVIETPGAQATVVITVPSTPTVPADGTAFKVWGYDFTVDSSSPYTSESFAVDTTPILGGVYTALNIGNMFLANLFFNRAVTITGDTDGPITVTLTWIECREQPRFSVDHMVFTGITAIGGSAVATNGTTPVYVEGYKIITNFGYYQDAAFTKLFPITKFSGIEPDKQCTDVGQVCVDFASDAQSMLYTELPELTSTSFITAIQCGRSLMRLFSIQYGWVYRDGCIAKSGTIKKSDMVLGINAAFDINDPYSMRRYWYAHPAGYPNGQFVSDYLTTQPKSIPLCADSFAWLWFLNNWQDVFGAYNVRARFVLYKKGVSGAFEFIETEINNHATDGHAWHQPINFNVSPRYVLDNAPTLTEETLDFYEVQVIGVTIPDDEVFDMTEYLRYVPGHCCDETTDIYFLTPAGGIGTILAEVEQRELVQDGQEISLQVDCGDTRSNRGRYGGRTLVSIRNYERITFRIDTPQTTDWERWLKHFRSSPQHWIKVLDETGFGLGVPGEPIAKKLIIQPDAAQIARSGGGIEFRCTGYLADIPTQKGTEL